MAWILALGFLSQALFGVRMVVQVVHTERAGKVASPTIYWQISLLGSFLFLIYGILRDDVVIILGQTLSYFIYIRNIQLKNEWKKIPLLLRVFLFTLPLGILGWISLGIDNRLSTILGNNDFADPILFIGATGQLLHNLRFIYQWYYSERVKASVLPIGFWLISAVASVMILVYAFDRPDPVLLGAQSFGILAYLRNIFVYYRSQKKI
ncbi:MAG TPA: lipid-A-disaccharide synthase N-terminal domain-containing protein [Ohtaekwangia sp.]